MTDSEHSMLELRLKNIEEEMKILPGIQKSLVAIETSLAIVTARGCAVGENRSAALHEKIDKKIEVVHKKIDGNNRMTVLISALASLVAAGLTALGLQK